MAIEVASGQILGRRQRQEDCLALYPDPAAPKLLVLSDGMGGHAGGDVASAVIVEAVVETYAAAAAEGDPPGSVLRAAAQRANKTIRARAKADPELRGMGGTLVAVRVLDGGVMFFSMGDSPLWRVRNGEAERLNADHSVGGMLDAAVARGELDAADARARRDRNAIISVLMGEPLDEMRMDETADLLPMGVGDTLVVASDGLDTLNPAQIGEIVSGARTSEDAVQALLAAVEAAGRPRQDNTSVIVVRF